MHGLYLIAHKRDTNTTHSMRSHCPEQCHMHACSVVISKRAARPANRDMHVCVSASARALTAPCPIRAHKQVHAGVLHGPQGPEGVAIKVQHKGVRRMMRADLANMKLAVDLLDL